jgi:plastocyanin
MRSSCRPRWPSAVAEHWHAALGLLAAVLLTGAAAAPATHTVTMDAMRFEPATLAVRRGDRVVWVNKDAFVHTATGAGFDSRPIAPGAWWSFVPSAAGDFAYRCTLHPTMAGRLVVQ